MTITRTSGNIIAAVLALALIGFLVVRTSSAAFNASTENTGNSLAAGTIALSDDDTASLALAPTNLAPGEFAQQCIRVSYTGTLDPRPVKVWSTSAFTTIAPAGGTNMQDKVLISLEQGTATSGGAFGSCAGFVPAAGADLLDEVPLSTFHSASTSYANGVGTWDPTGPGQTRAYRITLRLDHATGNLFQGASLRGINLTWGTESRADTPARP